MNEKEKLIMRINDIQEKYNDYGEQIEEAATVAAVNAITISYAP